MANNFDNNQLTLTNVTQTVLTADPSTTIVVFDTYVSNNHINETAFVTVQLQTAGKTTRLINNIPIPVGSSLNLPKMVLTSGDSILARVENSIVSNNVDMTMMTLVQS